MTLLKGVFWDVDGTLAETELNGHRKAFNEAFKEVNLDWHWDEETYIKLLDIHGGKNRINNYSKTLTLHLTHSDIDNIHHIKQNHYKRYIQDGSIDLRLGVRRLIEVLQDHGVEQWIVTTSGLRAVDSLLKHCLPTYQLLFKGIVTEEDVTHLKPNPEAYLKAINKSKIDPQSIVVIEDSIVGLNSAKSAKLKCLITIPPWTSLIPEQMHSADAIVDHLGDENNITKIYYGANSASGIIDIPYLSNLLSN